MTKGFCLCHTWTTSTLVAAHCLLFLALQVPVSASVPRGLPDSKHVLAVDLIPYHYSKAHYANPNLTLSQKAEIAAVSSQMRAQYLAGYFSNDSTKFGSSLDFQPTFTESGGAYIMDVTLGTPGSLFSVIVDTASDIPWVQCVGCRQIRCSPPPPAVLNLFDPAKSSSYATIPCNDTLCLTSNTNAACVSDRDTCMYYVPYLDNATSRGELGTDVLHMTDDYGDLVGYSGSFIFGCGTNQTGKYAPSDGVFGLGRGNPSLIEQAPTYTIPAIARIFSYCLVDWVDPSDKVGSLLLGSSGSSDLVYSYTPMVSNRFHPSLYYVTLVSIRVNGVPVNFPAGIFLIDDQGNGGLILDSSTTLTQFFPAIYAPFREAIRKSITYSNVTAAPGYDLCYNVPLTPTFPTVVFVFDGGANVTLANYNLFRQVASGVQCFAFAEVPPNVKFNIYGNTQQQNFQVVFDLIYFQVGFAYVVDC